MFHNSRSKSGTHRTPFWGHTPPGLVGTHDSTAEADHEHQPVDLSVDPPTPGLSQSPPWDLTSESLRRRRR